MHQHGSKPYRICATRLRGCTSCTPWQWPSCPATSCHHMARETTSGAACPRLLHETVHCSDAPKIDPATRWNLSRESRLCDTERLHCCIYSPVYLCTHCMNVFVKTVSLSCNTLVLHKSKRAPSKYCAIHLGLGVLSAGAHRSFIHNEEVRRPSPLPDPKLSICRLHFMAYGCVRVRRTAPALSYICRYTGLAVARVQNTMVFGHGQEAQGCELDE